MKKALIFFTIFISFIFVSSLQSQTETFTPSQLKEDFTVFRNALTEIYPSMYRFDTKENINGLFDKTFLEFDKPMSELDFLKRLIPMGAAFKDGHFRIQASIDFRKYIDERAKFFPLLLNFRADNTFIMAGGEDIIPAGSIITSVNGIKISDLRNELLKYAAGDGDILGGRLAVLSRRFYLFHLLNYGEQEEFIVGYTDNIGNESTVKLSSISKKEYDVIAKPKNQSEKSLSLLINDKNTAVLTIKTFSSSALEKNNENYSEFLKTSFNTLKEKNIQGLIIDLRDNSGGEDEYGAKLYSHLTNKEFKYYDYLRLNNNHISFLKYTNAPPDLNEQMKERVDSVGINDFRFKTEGHENLKLQKPEENNFAGKVIVLINRGTFSAAAEFCSIFHTMKRGQFAGEETGGTYIGNTSGISIELTLPNTKTIIPINLMRYEMAVDKNTFKGRGIIPDYPFERSINDILTGSDTEMKYALKLLVN